MTEQEARELVESLTEEEMLQLLEFLQAMKAE